MTWDRPFHTCSDCKFLGTNQSMKFFQPYIQHHLVPPDLPSQEAYRLGRRLARQVQWNKLKLCIWPKKIFIDSFNAKIMQLSRQGCSNCLNFFWKDLMFIDQRTHSSEKRGLRSTFLSSKMLQNLLYLQKKKTHVVFFVFHFEQL